VIAFMSSMEHQAVAADEPEGAREHLIGGCAIVAVAARQRSADLSDRAEGACQGYGSL
jgi:hypothetical protein